MKKIVLILSFLFGVACNNNHHDKNNHEIEHGHKHHEDMTNKHGSANAQMHQTSVNDLIEHFESPDRDAYQQPQKVLDYLGDIQGQIIMDIGAGSGYFSVKLAALGAKVIAADVDDEFLDYIKKRIDKDQLQHIETRKIPYDSPDLENEEADKVLIVNTYHHIENRIDYFGKVKRGTKPNGELIIIDFFKVELPVGPSVNHKIAMDDVINELKKAGYTSITVNADLLPYQYIIKAK